MFTICLNVLFSERNSENCKLKYGIEITEPGLEKLVLVYGEWR